MLHPDVEISSDKNPKKKQETVLFYKKTKPEVDVIDQIARKYFCKGWSKRWPIHLCYNAIELPLINSWNFFRDIYKLNISCQRFIKHVGKELTGANPDSDAGKNAAVRSRVGKITRFCFNYNYNLKFSIIIAIIQV